MFKDTNNSLFSLQSAWISWNTVVINGIIQTGIFRNDSLASYNVAQNLNYKYDC